MKKIICLFVALVVCLSIAVPVFAADTNGFVPSITYKPEPEIVPVKDENGQEHLGVIRDKDGQIISYVDDGCFRVTPIAHVWDPEIEVPEYIEELLTYVYEGLNKGELEINYDAFNADLDSNNMVIRDLFDIRWFCEEHLAMHLKEDNTIDIIFDLGVVADAEIFVATFNEDTKEWSPIVKTVNNGDGTVTCTFQHFCAISFSMPMTARVVATEATTSAATNLLPWILILLLAVVAFVVIIIVKNKK